MSELKNTARPAQIKTNHQTRNKHLNLLYFCAGPWCIAPNGEFDYCDIPACGSNSSTILFPDDSPGDIGSMLSNLWHEY